MKKELKFVKLSNRWFIDIPWDEDINDLEMVSGADKLIEFLSKDKLTLNVIVNTEPCDYNIKLEKIEENIDGVGSYYNVMFNENEKNEKIWLCDVTKYIFGNLPNKMYINII